MLRLAPLIVGVFVLLDSIVSGFLIYKLTQKKKYDFSNEDFVEARNIETKWIEQPLDHMNDSDKRTWKMRYFQNLEFWKPNGTVYLFIGGEGEAVPWWISNGIVYDLAKETNGAMFESEHRYYGQSMPLNNSITENLKYLSSTQALADLKTLLDHISTSLKPQKVVVVGGSYPGNLATWLKELYPNDIDAAIASSAPVLAKSNFYEYIETVATDYKKYGTPECYNKIAQIFKRFEQLLNSTEGIKQLKKEKNICETSDLTAPENKQTFFEYALYDFMRTAQYGTPDGIQDHCKHLYETDKREPFASCIEIDFYGSINSLKKSRDAISWIYQICTEFGYFQSTDSGNHPFTHNLPVEYHYKVCSTMFGPDFDKKRVDEGIVHTNKIYGGLHPNVTNVVFVNGELDPWHRLGILKNLSSEAPAIVIPKASHGADLEFSNPHDSEELKKAREDIKTLIKEWIGAI